MENPCGGEAVHFLSVNDVVALHKDLLSRTGGVAGIGDVGLLDSAVMMPQAGIGGVYFHEGLPAA